MFDFTFRVPFTIRNPFANNSNLNQNPQPPRLPRPGPNTRPRPIPRPEMLNKAWEVDPPMVQKRRRGWQPTETSGGVAEPQLSQSVSRGELDRLGSSGCIGMADDDQDFPPTKRRRTTLTDTLLTSALNIALISGAVGITAYRLWKGEPNAAGELEDTPAYDEEAWQVARATRSCPMSPSASSSSTKVTSSSSSSGHRRIRSHVANRRRPAFIAPPRPASSLASSVQYSGTTPDPTPLPVPTASATAEPEPEDEMDEQMDWMSAQLQQLIAEGQKALGKEIVVASDEFVGEEEGLVDDGDEDWQDDEPYDSRGRQSTSRHIRTLSASGRASPTKGRQLSPRKQPASLLTPDSSYLSRTSSLSRTSARQSLTLERPSQLDFSPLQPAFNLSSSYPTQTSFEGLYQSTQHVQPTFGQTQDSSPDLVSAMERVRKAYGLGA